jgi:hypothetical protein
LISSRFGAAVAIVLSIAALALAIVAFMSTVRDDEEKPGRLVQTRITASFDGDPIAFPVDEFFISRDGDGTMHALYAYPPGFFGHMRGCRVVWSADEPGENGVRGMFVDPCGGSRFARDGRLVSGPADRGLDYFEIDPGVEGIIADTRTLYCGLQYQPPTPAPAETAPAASPTASIGTRTVTTATAAPTSTSAPSATSTVTATATSEPQECDRVSPNSKR